MDLPPPLIEPLAAEDIVRTRAERPLRMAAVTEPTGFEPLIDYPPLRSAAPSYVVAISYDWRRNEPLAGTTEQDE